YDVCVVQEPYIDFKGHMGANQNWMMIYPNTHQKHPDNRTRSVSWKQINFEHLDITAIEIQGEFGMLCIINIYNNGDNNGALT
ncbi:hypothetical protein L208DRAFT_1041754, partial [Tricholoma matsutake]